uniref:CSON000219 protein n=1 Tax=Culicoides sonorensis TaxID=179676 RepID=A0A336LPM3_CULSO
MVTGIDPTGQIMTNHQQVSQSQLSHTQLGNIANGSPTSPQSGVHHSPPPQATTQANMPPTPQEPVKRPSDARRSNKPIMEKRRRARINNCLNELKTLILDAMKKDPARHSKLEKADILEMTVKHLQNLQRQQSTISQLADSNVMNKFKAGFTECANEVGRFPGIEPMVKRRLLQHLNNCINGVSSPIKHETPIAPHQSQTQQPNSTVQVHILPSPPSSPQQEPMLIQSSQITATANGYYLSNGSGAGIQLIPTKLSNGSVAFVLPQSIQPPAPVPMLVPIPTRTASTGSATSNTSLYDRMQSHRETSSSPYHTPPSPANSYDAMDCTPPSIHSHNIQNNNNNNSYHSSHQQYTNVRSYSPAPLSLVMRKTEEDDDDKPWRPW